MASVNHVILPEDVKLLVSQVAGHTQDKDKSTPGGYTDMHALCTLKIYYK